MKFAIKSVLLTIIVTVSGLAAFGQCSPRLTAEIPFDFVVNGRSAASGTYTIEKTNCTTSIPMVLMRDAAGRSLGLINIAAVELGLKNGERSPSMTFQFSGGQRVLTEVIDPPGRYSFRIPLRSGDRQLAKKAGARRTSIPLVTAGKDIR